MKRSNRRAKTVAALAACALLAPSSHSAHATHAAGLGGRHKAHRRHAHSDPATEIEKIIGRELERGIAASEGTDEDPLLLPWLKGIGAQVAAESPRHNVNYSFQILGTDIANAITLPGAYIFVTRGMLDEITSDDELATIMAHECGHVAERHAQKQIGENVAFLAFLSILHEPKYETLRTGATVANVLATLALSRSEEAQADRDGIKFAYAAGYDPRGLVVFFQGFENDNPSALERYFETHPTPKARIAHALDDPLVSKPTPALREQSARAFEARGLPREAARVRAGLNPLTLPPVPALPSPLPDYLASDRADTVKQTEEIRKGLRSSDKTQQIGSVLQEVLLVNSQPGDLRWLVLAAEAYAIQERADNLFARTLRVAQVAAPTFDDLTRATLAQPNDGALAREAAQGRSEIRAALLRDKEAPVPIRHASTAIATVLVDLNNRFYQPKGAASYLRYGADAALLTYASAELNRADRAAGVAWRQMSLARIRRYQTRLDALVPEGDADRRKLWLNLATRRFGSVVPDQGPTGDASVRAALAIELGASPMELQAAKDKKNETWADWVLESKGTPENVATALRLLTLDLERETASDGSIGSGSISRISRIGGVGVSREHATAKSDRAFVGAGLCRGDRSPRQRVASLGDRAR